jgi:hypothetical protein
VHCHASTPFRRLQIRIEEGMRQAATEVAVTQHMKGVLKPKVITQTVSFEE